jgi:hypothetical protein
LTAPLVAVLVVLCVPVVRGQTSLSAEGIQFPDGTEQTTAAATPEAWPEQCHETPSPGEDLYLSCFMYNGPAETAWDSVNGVPAGYFFLVTNVVVTPSTVDDTGEYWLWLEQKGGCDNGIEGGPQNGRDVSLRFVGPTQSWVLNSTAPILVLPAGHCLRVTASNDNTSPVKFHVNGYLTTDPAHFRP